MAIEENTPQDDSNAPVSNNDDSELENGTVDCTQLASFPVFQAMDHNPVFPNHNYNHDIDIELQDMSQDAHDSRVDANIDIGIEIDPNQNENQNPNPNPEPNVSIQEIRRANPRPPRFNDMFNQNRQQQQDERCCNNNSCFDRLTYNIRRMCRSPHVGKKDIWVVSLIAFVYFFACAWFMFIITYGYLPQSEMRLGKLVIDEGIKYADYCFSDYATPGSECEFEQAALINPFDDDNKWYPLQGRYVYERFGNLAIFDKYNYFPFDRSTNTSYDVYYGVTSNVAVFAYGVFSYDIVYLGSCLGFTLYCCVYICIFCYWCISGCVSCMR